MTSKIAVLIGHDIVSRITVIETINIYLIEDCSLRPVRSLESRNYSKFKVVRCFTAAACSVITYDQSSRMYLKMIPEPFGKLRYLYRVIIKYLVAAVMLHLKLFCSCHKEYVIYIIPCCSELNNNRISRIRFCRRYKLRGSVTEECTEIKHCC